MFALRSAFSLASRCLPKVRPLFASKLMIETAVKTLLARPDELLMLAQRNISKSTRYGTIKCRAKKKKFCRSRPRYQKRPKPPAKDQPECRLTRKGKVAKCPKSGKKGCPKKKKRRCPKRKKCVHSKRRHRRRHKRGGKKSRGRSHKKYKKRETQKEIESKWVPCYCSKRRSEFKCPSRQKKKTKLLANRDHCEPPPCPEFPRIDTYKYRFTDKSKKRYQQTWVECVRIRRKKKCECIFKYPRIKRRPIKPAQKAIACPKLDARALKNCLLNKKKKKSKCRKIKMPFCARVRTDPQCSASRKPDKCCKHYCQMPAYSECMRDRLPDLPPVECNCMKHVSLCAVWAAFRKKHHVKGKKAKTSV